MRHAFSSFAGERMHVTLNGTERFYSRYGRGTPLLVMHGGPGLDHTYFRPGLDVLGNVAEIIYFDHVGNGRSGGAEEVATLTVDAFADDAYALCQALRLPQVAILAHGFGGFIAQSFARRYSQQTLGLILCSSSAAFDYPEHMLAGAHGRGTAAQMAALMACIARPSPSDADLRTVWRQALPLYFYRYHPNQGAALADSIKFSAAAYNRGLFELAPYFNSSPWLAEIVAPTLILAGAHDWMTPTVQATDRLVQGIAGSQRVVFENSGHYPFIEETTAFCHTVRQFLRPIELKRTDGR
jgi:proline iminopeptidase